MAATLDAFGRKRDLSGANNMARICARVPSFVRLYPKASGWGVGQICGLAWKLEGLERTKLVYAPEEGECLGICAQDGGYKSFGYQVMFPIDCSCSKKKQVSKRKSLTRIIVYFRCEHLLIRYTL